MEDIGNNKFEDMDNNSDKVKVFTIKKHTPVIDDTGEHLNIQLFDFRRPSKFAKEQIRIMEIIHDSFSRIAESHVSIQTRTLTEISCNLVEQKTFGEYISSLSEHCHINILASSLFEGDTILHFRREAVFLILARILGGKGLEELDRDFTEIEKNLMNSVIRDFLLSLEEAWANILKLDLSVKRVETNPQFARVVANNEMCLVLNFEIKIDSNKSYFSFCLPFISIKSILDKLSTRSWFAYGKTIKDKYIKEYIIKNLSKVKLPVSVILGEANLSIREIQSLEEGDIIPLNKKTNSLISMLVGGKPFFKVQPGKSSGNMAVQIVRGNYYD
jgi:flagellar motor switch protein FliM